MSPANPIAYWTALNCLLATVWRQRRLTMAMAQREVSDRYVGQIIGAAWTILHPVLQLAVYWFLFAVVFQMRIPEQTGFLADYFLYILSGMVPWLAFSDAVCKGPTAISSQSALVKQVVFPIEVLPLKGVLTSFVPLGIMGSLLVVYKLVQGYPLMPGVFLLPIALVLQVALCTGINLVTSAAGTYLRDLKDIVQAVMLVVLYALPIFYLPDMVPPLFRPMISWNPLSHFIWCWQDVLYYNDVVHPWSWLVFAVGASLLLAVGARTFAFLKTHFGNVL